MELPVDGVAVGSGAAGAACGAAGASSGVNARSSSAGGAEAGRPYTDSSTRCFCTDSI